MILICDANSPIFQNYVQPKISPQRFASAPVLPPMRSRSGSKYAFGNQHMSNCRHVDVFIVRELIVKSIWSWGTRRMSYTMNFTMNSSPQFASSWNCQAKKTMPTRKGDAEEKKTCLLPDSLSSAYVDDTSTMKYATNACDMCLFLWFRLRRPLGQERLFVHCKALVHGCHVCFFNLADIPVILSKSFQIQYLTHLQKLICLKILTRAEMIAADRPTVFCSCCYRRLFMANIS